MTNIEAQQHIEECRRLLEDANIRNGLDIGESTVIGRIILAVEQLSFVVEDLAQREQGKVIA